MTTAVVAFGDIPTSTRQWDELPGIKGILNQASFRPGIDQSISDQEVVLWLEDLHPGPLHLQSWRTGPMVTYFLVNGSIPV